MTVEELLRRYPGYKASLKAKEIMLTALRDEIISSGPEGEVERVQSSSLSDITSAKAIRVINETQELEKEKAYYKFKVDIIENALSVLGDTEKDIVERICFKNQTYNKIDYETRTPRDTCRKIKKKALEKVEPYLQVLL